LAEEHGVRIRKSMMKLDRFSRYGSTPNWYCGSCEGL
jgi:hypothetical protein